MLLSPSTLASCAHQDLAVVTATVSPPYEPSLPSLTGMRLWSCSLKFLVTTTTAATPQRSFVADWLLCQGLLTQALYFTRVFVLSAQVSVLKKRPSLCSHRCCAENRPLKFLLPDLTSCILSHIHMKPGMSLDDHPTRIHSPIN